MRCGGIASTLIRPCILKVATFGLGGRVFYWQPLPRFRPPLPGASACPLRRSGGGTVFFSFGGAGRRQRWKQQAPPKLRPAARGGGGSLRLRRTLRMFYWQPLPSDSTESGGRCHPMRRPQSFATLGCVCAGAAHPSGVLLAAFTPFASLLSATSDCSGQLPPYSASRPPPERLRRWARRPAILRIAVFAVFDCATLRVVRPTPPPRGGVPLGTPAD